MQNRLFSSALFSLSILASIVVSTSMYPAEAVAMVDEELIAIEQLAQKNQAVNHAIVGNKALKDAMETVTGDSRRTEENKRTDTNNQQRNLETQVDYANSTNATATKHQKVEADKMILNHPVIDKAGVLSESEKQQLDNKLRSLYQQGLAQAAVVIVPTTNGVPTFDYAMKVAERWKLGNADTDDGLLILVAINDREIFILTGYGLEGVLPDSAVGRIIRNDIKPYFKQENYAGGLLVGINSIEERLVADPQILAQADKLAIEREQKKSKSDGEKINPIFLFFLCLFFGNIVTSILGRLLGGSLLAGGFFVFSLSVGASFIMSLVLAIFLWIFLVGNDSGGKGGGSGKGGRRKRNHTIIVPGGGGFGSGGSDGFGGGFGGGGGGFGGGGAGGSW